MSFEEANTAKNTVISPNFLVWKFCGKVQFLNHFGRFSRNYAETVPSHKIPHQEIRWNYAFFASCFFIRHGEYTSSFPIINWKNIYLLLKTLSEWRIWIFIRIRIRNVYKLENLLVIISCPIFPTHTWKHTVILKQVNIQTETITNVFYNEPSIFFKVTLKYLSSI